MSKAKTSVVVPGPREEVFRLFADRENYGALVPPVGCTLVEPGTAERQGTGAVHKVGIGPVGMKERITALEPGRSFTYQAVSGLPVRHWIGTVEFHDDPKGTRVDYSLDVEARVPVPAAVLAVVVKGLAGGLARGASKQLRK